MYTLFPRTRGIYKGFFICILYYTLQRKYNHEPVIGTILVFDCGGYPYYCIQQTDSWGAPPHIKSAIYAICIINNNFIICII